MIGVNDFKMMYQLTLIHTQFVIDFAYRIANVHIATVFDSDFTLFSARTTCERCWHDILMHHISFLNSWSQRFIHMSNCFDNYKH